MQLAAGDPSRASPMQFIRFVSNIIVGDHTDRSPGECSYVLMIALADISEVGAADVLTLVQAG